MEKHKFASISLTVQIERFRRNFRPTRYLRIVLLAIFKKFPLTKNGGHFEFSNFCQKMEKHKFATVSLTVPGRAISLKFSTHFRVSEKCTLGNFQKILPSPKMVAILNSGIFAKNGKTQICFQQNYPSPKMVAILNFRQKWQNTNLLLSP